MRESIHLRKACCGLRKLEPLSRLLTRRSAWVTGLRREQSGARAVVPFSELDDAGRTKFNPLADWSWHDVWHYIALHQVPYNPLHDEFFPSIGCEPCTRAVALGEDFRAGRWWWESEDAKECGLHVSHIHNQGDRGMNAPTPIEHLLPGLDHEHLDALEEEAIFILREVAASFERPALLFSGGKDSCVVLRLAEKAFKNHVSGRTSAASCPSRCCTWTRATTFRKSSTSVTSAWPRWASAW
jgi:sulfate adenylyltransferase subunit 2